MNRFPPRLAMLAPATLLLVALPALAATPINETRPLDPRGSIEIDNLKGRIEVRAWERAEVAITGSLGEGVEKLEIDGDRQHLSVKVKYPNRGGVGFFGGGDRTEPTTLILQVPLRADLEIDAVSAAIDVQGVAPGSLSIDSVSGDIEVAGAPRELDIDSVSGDIRLTVNSSEVGIDSVSGDIRLSGRLDGEVTVESVSGDVEVRGVESSLRRFEGETVSGDFELHTALAAGSRVAIESVSGDLRLHLPASLSARVEASSFSGDLEAPGATIDRPKHGPGASMNHRYGAGDGEIRLETFSGDAVIRLD